MPLNGPAQFLSTSSKLHTSLDINEQFAVIGILLVTGLSGRDR